MWAAREIVHLEIMRMPNRLCEVPLPLHIERMDDRRRAVAVCMCVKERHPRRVCSSAYYIRILTLDKANSVWIGWKWLNNSKINFKQA